MSEEITSAGRFLAGNGCSQAILTQFCEELGLDRLTALKISSGFPAGMQTAGVCGAVTGAYMVLGLRFAGPESAQSEGRRKVYEAVAEFNRRFRELHHTLNCRDLLGCDISTPEGRTVANEQNLFQTVCPGFVEASSTILRTILNPEDS